ncbi:hypothetical protein ABID29_000169 [Streptococcus rupicaprae]|uniref:Uncharacterized protein n=1 Tax=Streptococcus rupicaprae TaxID=759619 RepID=A0ABV2FF62_9STRE
MIAIAIGDDAQAFGLSKANAIKAYQDMLTVLKEDWDYQFGAEVDRTYPAKN